MNYNDIIRTKNKLLAATLLICIILRCCVNVYFVGIADVLPMGIGGLVFTLLLFLLANKIPPVPMMYLMVVLMSGISIALMMAFPCTTNYLMFFLTIFFVVIYEDIRPIVLQSVITCVCIIVFYYKYTAKISDSFGTDAMAMCVVYVISGVLVYISLCRMTKSQFLQLQKTHKKSDKERQKAEQLLDEIAKSVAELNTISGEINKNISITSEVSEQITDATENISQRTLSEVRDIEDIRDMVKNSVEQVQSMANSSTQMSNISQETNIQVQEGGKEVEILSEHMQQLNKKMDLIAASIAHLSDENTKIADILTTLDQITEQTNLLSLNASIEAARAGEQGKGFAVVATEIRQLSDDSAKFTEQIHDILKGIATSTSQVQNEIIDGQKSVQACTAHAGDVNNSFKAIADNTTQVLSQATNIESESQKLEDLMNTTLNSVNNINDVVESTSAAMEEISSSIVNLHGNIASIVEEYQNINNINVSLLRASENNQEDEAE